VRREALEGGHRAAPSLFEGPYIPGVGPQRGTSFANPTQGQHRQFALRRELANLNCAQVWSN
jgi:hypothetical protein